jgi:hypothetical protein
MLPVVTSGDFWAEKAKQLFRLNDHLDDFPRFAGEALIPLVLWFVIDWRIRKRRPVP